MLDLDQATQHQATNLCNKFNKTCLWINAFKALFSVLVQATVWRSSAIPIIKWFLRQKRLKKCFQKKQIKSGGAKSW